MNTYLKNTFFEMALMTGMYVVILTVCILVLSGTNPVTDSFTFDGPKRITLQGMGVLQLVAHGLFDVKRMDSMTPESAVDLENGRLDLTTSALLPGYAFAQVQDSNPTDGAFDVSEAVFIGSTLFRSQDVQPTGMAFSNDGLKMFVVGADNDNINEYTLSAAFDVPTATFVDAFSVSSQENSPSGMAFSNDGLKMFVVGSSGNDINEYELSTPFDVSTSEFVRARTIRQQETSPTGMAFSNDGLKMFVVGFRSDSINEYALSAPFTLFGRSFVNATSISTQATNPRDISFSNDGLKMFVVDWSESSAIHEYTLSAPFGVSTATHVDSLSVALQESSPRGMAFSNDGLKMFVVGSGGDDVNEYALNSAYLAEQGIPRLESIERYSPASENTDSPTLVYRATFSEGVTGVTASDFTLAPYSPGGTGANSVTSVSGSGDTYYVTVSTSTSGAYNLDLVSSGHNIADTANNPLTNTFPTGADEPYAVVIDIINPTLESIELYSPAFLYTNSQTLVYSVTFSEDVAGVTASDFTLSPDSTGGVGTTTGQFTQARSSNLAIPDLQTVSDDITVSDSGTVTSVSVTVDITHTYIGDLTIDLIAPDGTSEILHNGIGGDTADIDTTYIPYYFESIPISGVWTLRINDSHETDPGVLNSWTLTINYSNPVTTASPVTGVSGSGDTYHVTVSAPTDGTYNLDLVSSGHNITDAASNPLTNTAPAGADETYTVSIEILDSANPILESIERYNPASQNTDSQTLVYQATFSENVTGVTASDFTLSPDSTGGTGASPVTGVSGSGDTYYVTVSAPTDGTYNLDLVSSGHNITNAASNPLTNAAPTGADETYTVSTTVIDGTNPELESIERYNPASQNTDSQTLVYQATFSENVTGVTASDFTLSPDSTGGTGASPVTGVSGSGDTYHVTVSASTGGTYNLDLVPSGHNITDAASNPLTNAAPTGADETYTVSTTVIDGTNPELESIERYNPASQNTDSQTLVYQATFSENVTGVTASDFTLSPDSTGGTGASPVTGVSGSGDTYHVTVSASTDGTYNLDLVPSGHNITDAASNPLTNAAPTGADETYTVSTEILDSTNPTLESIERYSPASQNTDSQTLVYSVTFSENVTGVTASDFTLSPGSTGGTGASPVTGVSGSGDTYHVTVLATTDGTYNLDLASSGHGITDSADNPLADTAPTGADQTYTVSTVPADMTFPTISSIERHDPAVENTDSQTLVYRVTFSENVTGVDAADFALSSGSTGGGTSASGQFNQTRSPALAITSNNTVSDTITVPDSGTATSVSVTVDVSHTYIGDLKIDLIAPDDTTKTLHNRSGYGADDIDQTYAPDFGSVSIAGTWTLRINDNYAAADDGTLDSWTLTINHSSTASPVTTVSGSGDTYHVTVSAPADGTYNLDLVSSGHGIADTASNPLTDTAPTTGTDQTYTVSTVPADMTFPTISSIERHDPAVENTDSQTLVYRVTFSENVTGVDAADFALSSGSTGGGTSASGQFNQTRSPALAITSNNTVSDTITVPDSGTATSVSVTVDVSHTYIGDLKVDLIAPDDTTKTLHNRSGYGADDIDQTYAPDFGSVSIAGTWTLRINDNYAAADDGTLDSWTLTINHSSTASPVTTVSGSGDTYHVTVSAPADGTYNLDLVSSGHNITDAASNPLTNTAPAGADETYTVSIEILDSANPILESIERYNPASQNTDSQTLVYQATFSENVTGVTASDFTLSPDSTGGTGASPVTGVSGSGYTYHVTVSASTDGTYNLDLVSSGHNITDAASNPLTNTAPAGADETYTVSTEILDSTNPTLESIERYNPASQNTDSQTLVYQATFSENVTGVTASDFTLSPDSTGGTGASPVTGVSGSGDTYYVTVSAPTDGTYNLDLVSSGHNITNAASNPLTNAAPTGADETYTVSTTVIDGTNPELESIERYNPASQNTDSQTLVYGVTFSEDVTGVTASDFTLSPGSTGGTSAGTGSGQFMQTRSPNLAIPDLQTVSDTITVSDSGTVTSVSVTVDITHTYIGDLKIDIIAPDGTTRTLHNRSGNTINSIDKTYAPSFGSIPISGVWTLRIDDNYDADLGVLNSWMLTINYDNPVITASPVTGVSGSGDTYYVTVSASTDGTYNLDLVSSGHNITDAASNPLTNAAPTGADETHTVSTEILDSTNPTLESIERYSPASQNTDSQTLVYSVTFSENVTGVTASGFTLSPGSTGGTSAGTGSGQFMQTRSPNLAIPDLQTVSDDITVSDSGTVTSVSVTVDITHTYIGDLKIDIIAPDGTTRTLHNRSGNTINNIDKTYAPSFGSIPISGVWTLRINDNYDADPGVLNSWMLTINYDNPVTTASPVTGISGSGDTYHVTVSAPTDGTYNLDLVSSGHGIADAASNPLTNTTPTGADETYTVSN